jgi:hypothetical protein
MRFYEADQPKHGGIVNGNNKPERKINTATGDNQTRVGLPELNGWWRRYA